MKHFNIFYVFNNILFLKQKARTFSVTLMNILNLDKNIKQADKNRCQSIN